MPLGLHPCAKQRSLLASLVDWHRLPTAFYIGLIGPDRRVHHRERLAMGVVGCRCRRGESLSRWHRGKITARMRDHKRLVLAHDVCRLWHLMMVPRLMMHSFIEAG